MKITAIAIGLLVLSSAARADGPGTVIIEPAVIEAETVASSIRHDWVVILLTAAAAAAAVSN